MKKLLLALTVVLAATTAQAQSAGKACETPCEMVPCGGECWTVRVHYRRDGVSQIFNEESYYGSIASAECRADHIADHGFWIAEWEHPTKIPAGMVELVVIDRAVPVK